MALIRLHPDCIRCMLDKHLALCPSDVPTEIRLEYMQRILLLAAQARREQGAPIMLQEFQKVQQEMFGLEKDYTQTKAHFNALLMKREDEMWKHIGASSRPVEAAIQYAMIGNYIDFSASHSVQEQQLD